MVQNGIEPVWIVRGSFIWAVECPGVIGPTLQWEIVKGIQLWRYSQATINLPLQEVDGVYQVESDSSLCRSWTE